VEVARPVRRDSSVMLWVGPAVKAVRIAAALLTTDLPGSRAFPDTCLLGLNAA
jgi:hypothetical protein